MNKTTSLASLFAAALFAGCADAPVGPNLPPAMPVQFATLPGTDTDGAIATLQRVTARYHNLDVATADGFVLLHPCESRPGEGPVGIVYVNFARLLDGLVDPASPDALIYEPTRNGRERLVGVEFAIPYPLWTQQTPPQFLGATFQREDEFGVFALHVWVWRHNPDGLFAEANPNVSCGAA
ncbi:MAG TPA: hypothetical protein VJ717_18860 [Gemmatimonadaceae bacterium]|nr:hypothetical protein [Gemmatimonadaceae bacterium]